MHIRHTLRVLVLVIFLGATVLPAFAGDGTDALLIVGPAVLGTALVITVIAVLGTRSKEKPVVETPGSHGYAALPGSRAENLLPPPDAPHHASRSRTPRGSTGFAMLCQQGSVELTVACW